MTIMHAKTYTHVHIQQYENVQGAQVIRKLNRTNTLIHTYKCQNSEMHMSRNIINTYMFFYIKFDIMCNIQLFKCSVPFFVKYQIVCYLELS